jgi:hypothetical protein
MEVGDGTTVYSDHPVEIQRLCRTLAPRAVGDVEVSMVAVQGLDGSLHDARVLIASASNGVEFAFTSAGELAGVLLQLAPDSGAPKA